MNPLDLLPADVLGVFIDILTEVDYQISLVMFGLTNKAYHKLVTRSAIENKIPRALKCHKIALEGYLKILKFARKYGSEWDKKTCENAAKGGHLKVLKWARSKGCVWNSDTCTVM